MLSINLKIKSKLAVITTLSLALLFLLLITRTAAGAQNLNTGTDIVLGKNEIINKDYFAGGESVTISGIINGDAYIGAGRIIIDGTINGDLITGGGEIIINGSVTNNIRAAGGNITVNGKVGRSATLLGGNINLTSSADVAGSLVSAAGNLTVYAPINKDIYLGVGNATIGNRVGGDINAGAGNLTLTSNALVSGDLNYVSETPAKLLPGASVSGQLIHTLPPQGNREEIRARAEQSAAGFTLFMKVVGFGSLLIIGILIIKFFPKFSTETANIFGSQFWMSLVTGLIAIVITPIAFILLLITVFGIPLGFLLIFGFMAAICIAKVFVSIWLGTFIAAKLNRKWNLYILFLAGLGSLTILSLVPILNILITLVVSLAGFGALLISKKNFYIKLKNQI